MFAGLSRAIESSCTKTNLKKVEWVTARSLMRNVIFILRKCVCVFIYNYYVVHVRESLRVVVLQSDDLLLFLHSLF